VGFALEKLLRLALRRGMVIVQNPDDATAVARLGVIQDRIRLIPGAGVDTVRFQPQPEPEGLPVVMLASRLLWDKGVGEFVAAARKLAGRARFVLVGAPDPDNPASVTEAELRAWVAEGVIEWWGQREDMPATLGAAHLVCLPSYREGMPKVLLEAMACGRAVVTSDAPGCRDCVRDGDNGLLVPVKDVEALAAAIRRLLDDPDLRRRMGARGRERAVNEFAQAIVIEATLALYRNAVAAPPRTTGFAAGTGGR
jgi:glycosyltransferase involved in cell wall biosynthesis